MILRVKDKEGNVQEILAIKGSDYVLTDADKREIAEMAVELISTMPVSENIPSGEEVSY